MYHKKNEKKTKRQNKMDGGENRTLDHLIAGRGR